MNNYKLLVTSLFLITFLYSCKDEMEEGPYARPDWLAGKVYDQILERPEISTFAKCVELTGYDEIVNVSGSYTVFAPSNDAWDAYFQANPNYNSVEDIPVNELTRMVKYHIVQNPWSKSQLRSLDVFGWIDTLDITNNEPRGFKRETLLRDDNQKYGISYFGTGLNREPIIVDTLNTNKSRVVIADSRKYAPIFYKEYLDIYDLETSDYQFYFERPFESSDDIYFAGAKITSEEVFAENGIIYIVDKVVEPLETAYQMLADNEGNYNYSDFLDLLNLFPEFDYNEQRTNEQPGAEQGLEVDSLFDLTYPELVFDINREETSAPEGVFGLPPNVTIRYHHGLMAPTNEAFQSLINNYFKIPSGWQNIENAPEHIRRIVANTHLSFTPIYPTDFENGFYNGQKDIVRLDRDNIVEKRFGSNASFLGLNEPVIPRAFSSVAGPIYLRQGFRKFMFAIEESGLLPALKRENKDYSVFVESDANSDQDSSFFYDGEDFSAIERLGADNVEKVNLSTNDLRNLILNHVALRTPRGIARKEFIPNMAGNFLIFDNETGEVSGTGETTDGFRGTEPTPNYPREIGFDTDNGTTYEIDNWFSFTTSDIYAQVSARHPAFHDLLRQAGLALVKQYRYTFLSNNEFYTVFVPSEEALQNVDLSSLTKEELANFLRLHFVKGELIFTDGSASPGYYDTERIDEKSTQFTTVNTQLYIEPDYDVIRIKRKNGAGDVEVVESETANKLAGVRLIEEGEAAPYPSLYNNGVIHEIDEVLKVEELDTK